MTGSEALTDQTARQEALNPEASLIVQAPAGSGKTEVLTQRLLVLLSRVETPEQIVAITFTRKAANEMQRRVVQRLSEAQRQLDGESLDLEPHEQASVALAVEALRHAQSLHWELLDNPQRLNIYTIDTLNSSLVRKMPYLSRIGGQLRILEEPTPIYEQAVMDTLAAAEAESESDLAAAHRQALINLNGRETRLIGMLMSMLQRRDQWMRMSLAMQDREAFQAQMEEQLNAMLDSQFEACAQLLSTADWQQLSSLARVASEALVDDPEHPSHSLANLSFDHQTNWSLQDWQAVAATLLVKKADKIRSSVNKNDGFPPSRKAEKARMMALLQQLSDQHDAVDLLGGILCHPPQMPDAQEMALLFSLGVLLRRSNEQLLDQFAQLGAMDFIGVAQQALTALGSEDEPTDLTIQMDARIQHILMDEFQDTSRTQFELLCRLVRDWQDGDGRTLFLVGDPMQSIYRFREAEVSLFSRVRRAQTVNQVSVRPLQLETNFRSNTELVDDFNIIFKPVMAAEERPDLGAIAYAEASAGRGQANSDHLRLGIIESSNDDRQASRKLEADWVVEEVEAGLQDFEGTVAVLVRGRSYASDIVAELKRRGIPFQGVEMDPLVSRQIVQDLNTITQALQHRGDRLHWLAMLRMPGMGFTMADLTKLLGMDQQRPVLDLLRENIHRIDGPAQARLQQFLRITEAAIHQLPNAELSAVVEAVWLGLGGAGMVRTASDVEDVEAFLGLLREVAAEFEGVALQQRLAEKLGRLYAAPSTRKDAERVQLMTIHKAKGLEFDVVILPGLDRTGRGRDDRPLEWLEQDDVMLAAPKLTANPDSASGLYDYIRHSNRQMEDYESQRVLYVAATRARERLCLPVVISEKNRTGEGPGTGSLLGKLWPGIEPYTTDRVFLDPGEDQAEGESGGGSQPLVRFTQAPALIPPLLSLTHAEPEIENALPEQLGSLVTQAAGTALHYLLEVIHDQGIAKQDLDLDRMERLTHWVLREQGVPADEIDSIGQQVMAGLNTVIGDPAIWSAIGATDKPSSAAELVLLERDGNRLRTHIIDRVYKDARGKTHIIDYKFTDQDPNANEKWQAQLDRYRAVWNLMEPDAVIDTRVLPIRPAEDSG